MKQIFKISFLVVLLLNLCQYKVLAQNVLNKIHFEIQKNGQILKFGDVGGWNNPQFSEADLNNDGLLDLVVFERTDFRFFTFLNGGTPNTTDYTYAPEFAKNFPNVSYWALARDYNCDGIPDLFARPAEPVDGVAVFKGYYNAQNQLAFTRIPFWDYFYDILFYYNPNNFPLNVYVPLSDVPAIDDIDNDGDLDVLSFRPSGGYMTFYRNLSAEQGFGCDSLIFELRTDCWGRFLESVTSNNVFLSPNIDSCYGTAYFTSENGGSRHAGSTTMSFDIDNDGDKEVVLGDISYNNLTLLVNGGTPDIAFMTSQDPTFPDYDEPVRLEIFPAAFYLDVNNDGKKDLLVAPNEPNLSENVDVAWFYENIQTNASPLFSIVQKDFLVGEMFDGGTRTAPTFFDYNADGLLDLVVGNMGIFGTTGIDHARLYLFKNVGTANQPAFDLIDEDYLNLTAFNLRSIHPTFGDVDGDGDQDLIFGEESGKLFFFENTAGAGNSATFGNIVPDYQNIDVGSFSTPQLVDLNRDQLMDLVVGSYAGFLTYYQNTGTAANPTFTFTPNQNPNNALGGVDARPLGFGEGNAAPFFYDHNGSYQLYVGNLGGHLKAYDNIDGNLDSIFTKTTDTLGGIYEGIHTKLAVANLNNDNYLEFVIGTQRGGIAFYSADPTIFTRPITSRPPSFRLFPNPATDFLYIESEGVLTSNLTVQILNNLGQVLEQQHFTQFSDRRLRISIAHLPAGMYFCRILGEQGQFAQPFVLKK